MSDITVHEAQVLHAEDVRVEMRGNMRGQGIVCQDDDDIEVLV